MPITVKVKIADGVGGSHAKNFQNLTCRFPRIQV